MHLSVCARACDVCVRARVLGGAFAGRSALGHSGARPTAGFGRRAFSPRQRPLGTFSSCGAVGDAGRFGERTDAPLRTACRTAGCDGRLCKTMPFLKAHDDAYLYIIPIVYDAAYHAYCIAHNALHVRTALRFGVLS